MKLKGEFFAKIKWLRTQPEGVKTRYVWVSAFVVFAIVVLLWAGLFRKYERKAADSEKNMELIIEEGKKIKDDIGSKIKMPDIKLPEKETPSASSELSPENLK